MRPSAGIFAATLLHVLKQVTHAMLKMTCYCPNHPTREAVALFVWRACCSSRISLSFSAKVASCRFRRCSTLPVPNTSSHLQRFRVHTRMRRLCMSGPGLATIKSTSSRHFQMLSTHACTSNLLWRASEERCRNT